MSETISWGAGGVSWSKEAGNVSDGEYATYLADMQANFDKYTGAITALFTVDIHGNDPWATWLDEFVGKERQFHNCNACKSFVNHFGTLAIVMQDGSLRSPIWIPEQAPALYVPSVTAMARAVQNGRIKAPFKSQKAPLGVQVTGQWRHLSLSLPRVHLHQRMDVTAEQYAAEKVQDFQNVKRALKDFDLATLDKVVALLESDSLTRSEKFLAPAKWLRDLQHRVRAHLPGLLNSYQENIIWLAVAQAGAGFCHPRSGMLSTLLNDLSNGMPIEQAAKSWTAKLHPLKYQRPVAPPAEGAVLQAQKVFSQLSLESALQRRYARVEEIEAIWHARSLGVPSGVFSDLLQSKREPGIAVPGIKTMSFVKFERDVLPIAQSIKLHVPNKSSFSAFVAAVDPNAGCLFQWDSPDNRNAFSWYLLADQYGSPGSYASAWGLTTGTWANVTALSYIPAMWGARPLTQWGKNVLWVLDGAHPPPTSNLCLFPETMRSELHGVRSVIEAYSKTRRIEDSQHASACGLLMNEGGLKVNIQVHTKEIRANYIIDRWE